MSRMQAEVREAHLEDALFLADLWADSLRRADTEEQVADLETIIKAAVESPEIAVLIAEYDGRPAGAVYVRMSTMSPLNLEPTMQMFSLTVLPQYRRKGVGHALLDAAVGFAERAGVPFVATYAASASRDGNRFLARLGFGPQALWRVASAHTVRSKLTPRAPVTQRRPMSHTSLVVAARRSMRRAHAEV